MIKLEVEEQGTRITGTARVACYCRDKVFAGGDAGDIRGIGVGKSDRN